MKQILVHQSENMSSVALLEQNKLVEFYIDRANQGLQVGNIYKGKIVNVLDGMQAAFVDIGMERNAFIYIDDLLPANLEKQPDEKPNISDMIKVGQEIVVQVTKDEIGKKGARVTTHYAIPGRWIVYMPDAGYIGISKKIASDEERTRLKELGEHWKAEKEGMIFRTVAEEESEESLKKDFLFLRNLWNNIHKKSVSSKGPCLMYRELDLIPRLIRDLFNEHIQQVWVNNVDAKEDIIKLLEETAPSLVERVELHHKKAPLYQVFGVEEQLDKLFRHKVWMPSGGYLIIDHTEALTVIDVNTGKYTGSINLEQTVFDTNVEAAELIARLIRLRDIGGIIVIDFIDMNDEEHRQTVMDRLSEQMKNDRTKSMVVGWTKLGLLEITRKKVRENLDDWLVHQCKQCHGSGKIYSSWLNEIY